MWYWEETHNQKVVGLKPAPYTGWIFFLFFTLFVVPRNCIVCLKKSENKQKRGWGRPILKKKMEDMNYCDVIININISL